MASALDSLKALLTPHNAAAAAARRSPGAGAAINAIAQSRGTAAKGSLAVVPIDDSTTTPIRASAQAAPRSKIACAALFKDLSSVGSRRRLVSQIGGTINAQRKAPHKAPASAPWIGSKLRR